MLKWDEEFESIAQEMSEALAEFNKINYDLQLALTETGYSKDYIEFIATRLCNIYEKIVISANDYNRHETNRILAEHGMEPFFRRRKNTAKE